MTQATNDRQQLLELAADGSVESRKVLVTTLGDVFARKESQLNARERSLIGEILDTLLRDFDTALRRELAERLADKPNVPRRVIIALAKDEIDVARTILLRSFLLRDRELIDIIETRSREHQMAIAMRQTVSEAVSDALVDTGNEGVVTILLSNPKARIAEKTMASLVEEARGVESYREPLVMREDLGPNLARRIYVWVSASLRARLVDRFNLDDEELGQELTGLVESLIDSDHKDTGSAADPAAAGGPTRPAAARDDITPDLLIQALRRGEAGAFEALFGRLSEIRPSRLQDVLYRGDGRNLAAVCRALGLPKARFAELFLLVRKGPTDSTATDPRDLAKAVKHFDRITADGAREALRRWQGVADGAGGADGAPLREAGGLGG